MAVLLLGGISSLLVGGPVWWLAWKPRNQPQAAEAIPPGRRVYLIAFFGVSAVVALITLLVIGYRVFEFLLGDVTGGSLLDRIRAPFGLLVAAALAAPSAQAQASAAAGSCCTYSMASAPWPAAVYGSSRRDFS